MLDDADRTFLGTARRAVLATNAPDGRARLVPVCFALAPDLPVLYTPLDDKPKRVDDPLALARVRDILADPRVTVLVDRWDEDWSRLAWLRCAGRAELLQPGDPDHPAAIAALRARYEQYLMHVLEARPIIAITIDRVTRWAAVPS